MMVWTEKGRTAEGTDGGDGMIKDEGQEAEAEEVCMHVRTHLYPMTACACVHV